jgi:ABC-type Fe3+-siderophore transport system permease subunit
LCSGNAFATIGAFAQPAAAFVGGAFATLIVWRFARSGGGVDPAMLLRFQASRSTVLSELASAS